MTSATRRGVVANSSVCDRVTPNDQGAAHCRNSRSPDCTGEPARSGALALLVQAGARAVAMHSPGRQQCRIRIVALTDPPTRCRGWRRSGGRHRSRAQSPRRPPRSRLRAGDPRARWLHRRGGDSRGRTTLGQHERQPASTDPPRARPNAARCPAPQDERDECPARPHRPSKTSRRFRPPGLATKCPRGERRASGPKSAIAINRTRPCQCVRFRRPSRSVIGPKSARRRGPRAAA